MFILANTFGTGFGAAMSLVLFVGFIAFALAMACLEERKRYAAIVAARPKNRRRWLVARIEDIREEIANCEEELRQLQRPLAEAQNVNDDSIPPTLSGQEAV